MSIEKWFAVYFPLKSKTICTLKTAKWATGIVGAILAGYDSVYSFVMESQESNGHHTCFIFRIKWSILDSVDSVLYSFGPFVVMFTTNFAVVFMFMRVKCQRTNSMESTNQGLSKSATSGTAMVVTVSLAFLILTSPTAVVVLLYGWSSLGKHFPLYRAFINITQYLNHSINGVLYCVVGSRFRKELFTLICRKEISKTSKQQQRKVTEQFSQK